MGQQLVSLARTISSRDSNSQTTDKNRQLKAHVCVVNLSISFEVEFLPKRKKTNIVETRVKVLPVSPCVCCLYLWPEKAILKEKNCALPSEDLHSLSVRSTHIRDKRKKGKKKLVELVASSRHLVNFFETLRIMISFRGEWVRSRLVVITLFLPGRCFSVVSKITTSEATATWATAAAKKKKTFGGRNRTLGVWQTSSSLTVSEIIFLALCFSFFVLFSTSTAAAAAVESDGCDFDSFWRCPNNIQGLMNRSLERKRKSPEHINLTSRRFPSPIPRPMTTHRLDTRFPRWQVFFLLPFFDGYVGGRMGMLTRRILKPNDRTLPSPMYFSEWISKGFSLFIRSASFPALLLYEPWCLPGIGTGIVGTQTLYLPKEEAHEISGTSYITFFFLSSFAAATSPSLSTTTVTIKQKNSKLQEKDFFPRSNFEQSSRMTPCQVNWKGLPPLLLV